MKSSKIFILLFLTFSLFVGNETSTINNPQEEKISKGMLILQNNTKTRMPLEIWIKKSHSKGEKESYELFLKIKLKKQMVFDLYPKQRKNLRHPKKPGKIVFHSEEGSSVQAYYDLSKNGKSFTLRYDEECLYFLTDETDELY